ncbi:transposable element Tcb2 transposase [Trichonephila clavipes]|nr:transposable element Tcb2 transposase [Trichonephila clavipes]
MHLTQKVVFNDESRLNLSSDDKHVRVWRSRGERLNSAFALQRHTALKDGVMPHVLLLMAALPGAIFQQDNARPHAANISQDLFLHITILPWPTPFPDLSLIEHIWDHLE